jgi:hypothetical protein
MAPNIVPSARKKMPPKLAHAKPQISLKGDLIRSISTSEPLQAAEIFQLQRSTFADYFSHYRGGKRIPAKMPKFEHNIGKVDFYGKGWHVHSAHPSEKPFWVPKP